VGRATREEPRDGGQDEQDGLLFSLITALPACRIDTAGGSAACRDDDPHSAAAVRAVHGLL